MFCFNTKLSDKLKKVDITKLKEYVVKFIYDNEQDDLKITLNELFDRKGTIDLYYGILYGRWYDLTTYYYTLPAIIIRSKLRVDDKCDILSYILNKYEFDLNKKQLRNNNKYFGNVLFETYRACHYININIRIYELLLDHGVKINTIYTYKQHDTYLRKKMTVLDIYDFHNHTICQKEYCDKIKEYLISKGAKTNKELFQ